MIDWMGISYEIMKASSRREKRTRLIVGKGSKGLMVMNDYKYFYKSESFK